jgi:Glycosyl transferase family 2
MRCDDNPVLDRLRRLDPRARHSHDALEAKLDTLSQQVAGLGEAVGRIADGQHKLVEGQAELRTRVRRAQALTARAYEALQGWPELLATARAMEDYDLAFTDAEPLVSIPIPTYHSPDTLCARALASVLSQTYSNWEAIVVGDHCTDDTDERLSAIGDARIRFHNLSVRENDPDDPWERWAVRGSVPRSVGIQMAKGRWIAPLSHDDAWDPSHLYTLLAETREQRSEVAYSRMRIVAAEDPAHPTVGTIGAYPPKLGQWGWQSAIFHGGLRFLRYDRACALASEPNDWNLARRAWEVGVRFHHVPRETVTLFVYDRQGSIRADLDAMGLPATAAADTP